MLYIYPISVYTIINIRCVYFLVNIIYKNHYKDK